jgi:hypothetical protein
MKNPGQPDRIVKHGQAGILIEDFARGIFLSVEAPEKARWMWLVSMGLSKPIGNGRWELSAMHVLELGVN